MLCACALVCLHCVHTQCEMYACGLCVSSWSADFVFGEQSVHVPYIVVSVCMCPTLWAVCVCAICYVCVIWAGIEYSVYTA